MRAKSSLVACLCLLAITHAISFYWHVRGDQIYFVRFTFGETLPLIVISFVLPMLAYFLLGVMAESRRQFLLFILVTIIACQIEYLFVDWTAGRFWMPWVSENYGRWTREILWRFAWPVVFVSLGALAGVFRRRRLFVLRSKHA